MDPSLRYRLFGVSADGPMPPPHLDARAPAPPGESAWFRYLTDDPVAHGWAYAKLAEDYQRAQMTHFGDTRRRPEPLYLSVPQPPRPSLSEMLLQGADEWRTAGQALDRALERFTPPELRPLASGAGTVASYLAPDIPTTLEDVAYALEGDPYARHLLAEGLAWTLAFAPLSFIGAGRAARNVARPVR